MEKAKDPSIPKEFAIIFFLLKNGLSVRLECSIIFKGDRFNEKIIFLYFITHRAGVDFSPGLLHKKVGHESSGQRFDRSLLKIIKKSAASLPDKELIEIMGND